MKIDRLIGILSILLQEEKINCSGIGEKVCSSTNGRLIVLARRIGR